MIGKKSLDPGIVFVPYIMTQSTPIIIEGLDIKSNRMSKINKIFNLGKVINVSGFSPSKLIRSRYSTNIINNKFYGKVEINKNPT